MKQHVLLLSLQAGVAVVLAASQGVLTQTTAATETKKGAALAKLHPPTFPPLANQARIAGDVELELGIRQDGSVESATVVSGHPLLAQAAMESAKLSQFQCYGCAHSVTS